MIEEKGHVLILYSLWMEQKPQFEKKTCMQIRHIFFFFFFDLFIYLFPPPLFMELDESFRNNKFEMSMHIF